MKEKIRAHIEELFKEAPKTRRTFDLKEELISNLNEKYTDMVNNGKSEEDSYNAVIAGIGDVSDIIRELQREYMASELDDETERRKSAAIITMSVGMYIIAFLSMIIIEEFTTLSKRGTLSFIVMVIIAMVPTMMLVYHFASKPRYARKDESIAEDFITWSKRSVNNKQMMRSIYSIVWLIAVAMFFILMFIYHMWATAWIIFIIAALVTQVIKLMINNRYY